MNRQAAKAAKGFFGWGLAGLMVAGSGLVMSSACGSKESTSQTIPGNGGSSGMAAGDAAADSLGTGNDEWSACSGRDCVLVLLRCCTCIPKSINEYTAVNIRHEDEARSAICAGNVACGPCPAPPPGIPSAEAGFAALCKSGHCEAVDIGSSPFSECKASTDCELQYGTKCCDGCGNEDLIAVNPAANLHREICGDIEPPCEPPAPYCLDQRTGSPLAVCNATTGHCEVAGLGPMQ